MSMHPGEEATGDSAPAKRARSWTARVPQPARHLEWLAWFVFPVASSAWVSTRYSRTWWHWDEWRVLNRGLGGAFSEFYGHLIPLVHVVYWAQRTWVGLDEHWLVFAFFVASLACLQLAIALVLYRLGVPTVLALGVGTVVAYFGPGAENMVWQFQFGLTLALAFSIAAAGVVLGTRRHPWLVAALLVGGMSWDVNITLLGGLFVGIIAVWLWPSRDVLRALAVPAVFASAWTVFGDRGVYIDPTFDQFKDFSYRLLTLAASGLVGGGETIGAVGRRIGGQTPDQPVIPVDGQLLGLVLIGAVIALFLVRTPPRRERAVFVAGICTAMCTTVTLAWTRAWMSAELAGSRYVQWVAVFLVLAFAPVVWSAIRGWPYSAAAAGVFLIVVFSLNLQQLYPIRQLEEVWGQNERRVVEQAIRDMPDDRRAEVVPYLSAGMLRQLVREGAFDTGRSDSTR